MSDTMPRLYDLLPAIHRQRDVALGEPLKALFAVIEDEFRLVERDIAGLYDNWFVETCDEWVVPYIGDLLNVRGLLPVAEGAALSQRALVANSLAYRRRKGTAAVLEQLARDVTGWPAKAVEFFERLATTQHVNHPRLANLATVDLRNADELELTGGPHERATHTAEVRHVDRGRGRYNIPNVGLFLWRLQPYAVARGEARPVAQPPDGRYTFSPLGNDAPLFVRPRTEREITHLAGEEDVPGLLRRRLLFDELEALRQALVDAEAPPPARFFGAPPAFTVSVPPIAGGEPEDIPPEQVLICDLSDPDPAAPPSDWRRPPTTLPYRRNVAPPDDPPVLRDIRVAVDPVTGRLAFREGVVPDRVLVSYAYGFGGDLGGGPYDRRASVADWLPRGNRRRVWQVGVDRDAPAGSGPVGLFRNADPTGRRPIVRSLAEAVAGWNVALTEIPAPGDDDAAGDEGLVGIIAVTDSATYAEELTGDGKISVPAGSRLAIVAAAWPERSGPSQPGVPRRTVGQLAPRGGRPHLVGDLEVEGVLAADAAGRVAGEFVLDGLLLEGRITVVEGDLGSLRLAHCTLVPGRGLDARGEPLQPERPSLVVLPPGGAAGPGTNDRLQVRLDRCITGPLRVPARLTGLEVTDSIVDSPTRAGRAFVHPGLISGSLSALNVTSTTPTVRVTIGDEGPRRVVLSERPTTLAQARDLLQAAIRATPAASLAFQGAAVVTNPDVDRLIILPGFARDVVIESDGDDPTAVELRLDPAQARPISALVGGVVTLPMPGPAPQLLVTIGDEGPRAVTLAEVPETIAQARDALQAAIRAAPDGSEAFTRALVASLENRLVVLPGVGDDPVWVDEAPGGRAGLLALALESDRPAIAASAGGNEPGPPTTVERSTVFGPVHVAELRASEVLFTGPLLVERRQTGCVRFSYVPPGARTPRRFRCQPDQHLAALTAETERRAAAEGRALTDAERDAIRLAVERSVLPVFTAGRYGRPAYGQLAQTCAEAIRTGAEDESEIGAFHFLQQPRRLTNLRSSLDEYLRFGLEAGVFLAT